MFRTRWADRYAFAFELWRDRARVVLDPRLEALLLDDGPESAAAQDLLEALVPRAAGPAPVWMLVESGEIARRLGARRPGTTFLPRSEASAVLRDEAWEIAILDVTGWATGQRDAVSAVLSHLGALRRAAARGRSVVLAAPAGEGGLDFEGLAEVMVQGLGGGRLYGLWRVPMAAAASLGAASEEEEELDEDDEVPLDYDNTFGAQDPAYDEYLGVQGDAEPLGPGLSLVELPGAAREERNVSGREPRELVPQPAPEVGEAAGRALEAALAREQALKWRVGQLEHELAQAIARPVEALEAEVAHLRAELERRGRSAEDGPADLGRAPAPVPARGSEDLASARDRNARATQAVVRVVDGLVKRIERGGIGTLQLRRELVALRRRLQA